MHLLLHLDEDDANYAGHLAALGYLVTQADSLDAGRRVMEHGQVDAIVVDISSLDTGGLTWLRELSDSHPEILRLARCSAEDGSTVGQVVDVAHQVLIRPCSASGLSRAIEDAALIRRILGNPRLDGLAASIGRLPRPPKATLEVYRLAAKADLDGVCAVIEGEPVLTARVLHAVNTPFFGLPRTVTSVRDAALYLGLEYLVGLVVGESVSGAFDPGPAGHQRLLAEVQERGRRAAAFVRTIGAGLGAATSLISASFTAAMLRDVGIPLLAVTPTDDVDTSPGGLKTLMRERTIEPLGVTVGGLGAYLLSAWSLPDVVAVAVAAHEELPRVLTGEDPGPIDLVSISARLADGGESALEDDEFVAVLKALSMYDVCQAAVAAQPS